MLRIFFARVILFFDVRLRFINIDYIDSLRGISNSRKGIHSLNPTKKHNTIPIKTVSAREYYALVLFWSGIAPHPRFNELEKLPKSYTFWVRFSYRIVKSIFNVMNRVNPPIQESVKGKTQGAIWANSLTLNDSVVSDARKDANLSDLTIIIPVFNAYEYVKSCLDSVFATSDLLDILVIDDASTDPQVSPYLVSLETKGKIRLITNQINKGFVKTVNLGFANSSTNDVVLLNSDTVVFDGWLEGLVNASHAIENVATVTAMSNAATIFSLPFTQEFECDPRLTRVMAEEFRQSHRPKDPILEIPTCHGFCVLIRREALNQVGFFDGETFGLGYGEENDFSMRASQLGYKNLLAPNVVVHHYGSKSFQDSTKALAQVNMQSLLRRYPNYLGKLNDFLEKRQLNEYRLRAIRAISQSGLIEVSVHLTHSLGGGVRKSIDMETKNSSAIQLIIEPIDQFSMSLRFLYRDLLFEVVLESLPGENVFQILFDYLSIQSFTIQHLLGYSTELKNSLMETNAEKTLRLHDFYYICPKIHLVGKENKDCNVPDIGSCNNCLQSDADFDIETYRLSMVPILRGVSRISAPSRDTAQRYQKVIKNLEVSLSPFDIPKSKINLPPVPPERDRIVIAILGELTKHKGLDLVLELAGSPQAKKFKFEVIGSLPTGTNVIGSNIRVHGKYKHISELIERVISVRPDIFLFPGRIPETFSYTLSEALRFEIPIAYFETGAIAERLVGYSHGIPFDLNAEVNEILSQISRIMLEYKVKG
jgi:GT2 family glycosyltransferase